jgi:plasmid replication initiation protein
MKKVEPPQPNRGDVRLIRKANELVEARYRYDIWETRIFAQMLSMVKYEDTDFQEYKIHLNDVIKTFNLDGGGKAYKFLVQGAKDLVNKKLLIERERDGQQTELDTWLLTSAEYFKSPSGDGNYVVVTFHPALKPYLLELKNRYLVYDIRNILKLTSSYSIRIYELLKQYEKIGKRTFEVENLKLILGVLPGEYKLYGHFKDKVILKAQQDLGKETDISFDFEEGKKGKKIVSITFHIKANKERHNERDLTDLFEDVTDEKNNEPMATSKGFTDLLDQVSAWGISATTLQNLIKDHGEEAVQEGLQITLEKIKKDGLMDKPSGFFVKAIGEGWKSSKQVKQDITAQQQKKTKVATEKIQEELTKWDIALNSLRENRLAESKEIVRMLTQNDPQLAENAVNAILADSFTTAMLEKDTGLQLATLQLEDWRQQPALRAAVIRQIEKMSPTDFTSIQTTYDEPIRRAAKMTNELKAKL